MVFGDVERLEVVVIKLDLGTLDDRETEADEDVLKLSLSHRERVDVTHFAFGGKGDIDLFFVQLKLKEPVLHLSAALFYRRLYVGADFVRELTDKGAFFCGELSHAAKHGGKLALFAEIADSQRLDVRGIVAELRLCVGADLFKQFSHIYILSNDLLVFSFGIEGNTARVAAVADLFLERDPFFEVDPACVCNHQGVIEDVVKLLLDRTLEVIRTRRVAVPAGLDPGKLADFLNELYEVMLGVFTGKTAILVVL